MKLIDKFAASIGYFPKKQARSFLAAQVGRLTMDWATSTLSADASTRWTLETMRARSRDLRDNNDYARKFITMLKNNVIGEGGMLLKSNVRDMDQWKGGKRIPGAADVFANTLIEESFWEWSRKNNCSVTRCQSWVDVQRIALETIAVDGEILLRKVRGFQNPFSFALQLIECDRLDVNRNELLPGGGEIRMGVELNQWGERIAYWLLERNPNDVTYGTGSGYTSRRHPASDFIHAFLPVRPSQTRGVPWMVTAMVGLNQLGKYQEAELVASRLAASKMGVFKNMGQGADYTGEQIEGGISMDVEPGSFEQLPPGLEFQAIDWNHPNSAYAEFMKTALRGIASGLGCSYNILADDMQSVNFSSGRLGLEEPRATYRALQNWFAETVCDDIFADWLMIQLANKNIPLPIAKFNKFNSPVWRGKRWPYIQPVDDAKAAIMRINSGLSSLTKELAALNIDRDEHLDEIASDQEAVESRDLDLPELFGIGDEMKAEAAAEAAPETSLDNEIGDANSSNQKD